MRAPGLLTTLACVILLAACGAEVAGTAATVGKSQALQVEQAKAQQEQIKRNLGAALQAGEAAASAAAQQ